MEDAPVITVASETREPSLIRLLFTPLASLRLTVTLLAMAIFLILAGTVAQVDKGIWHIIEEYFRCWIVWVSAEVFFPRDYVIPNWIGVWFPGGTLIGTALAVNLLAAYTLRFRIQTKGIRLAGGLAIIILGIAATAFVIYSGSNKGIEDQFGHWLWNGFRAGLAGIWLASTTSLILVRGDRNAAWWWLMAISSLVGVSAVWLLVDPTVRLAPANMRILWQLTKATSAGVVLLIGCTMVFRKRGGVVLLHGGVMLMMLGELLTGMYADEAIMTIPEGQSSNYVQDTRAIELAVIDVSKKSEDHATVITQRMLVDNATVDSKAQKDPRITNSQLPFSLRVIKFYHNSVPVSHDRIEEKPLGNRGLARLWALRSLDVTAGTSTGDNVDRPGAYIEFFDKKSDQSLGVYLLHIAFDETGIHQTIEVDGKPYQVALRLKRSYKPYTITVDKIRADMYIGTNTPKNYSSRIHLVDPEHGEDRTATIWMNNPFRYEKTGETFYQQGYAVDERGRKITTLQVVTNRGWMIPYVACMLVTVGMLSHFLVTLNRFLNRRQQLTEETETSEGIWPVVIPVAIVLLASAYLGSKTRSPSISPSEMRLDEAGKIPVAYEGRIKPLDSVARNSLRIISNRGSFHVEGKKHPPIQWLLDVISESPTANKHKVFRIDNPQVLDALGLAPRSGFRYSLEEIESKREDGTERLPRKFLAQMAGARQKDDKDWNTTERAAMKLWRRWNHYQILAMSFHVPDIRKDHVEKDLGAFIRDIKSLERHGVHAVPPSTPGGAWQILPKIEVASIVANHKRPDALVLRKILGAYEQGNAAEFNTNLSQYLERLVKLEANQNEHLKSLQANSQEPGGIAHAETLSLARVNFETFLNRFAPFNLSLALYLAVFLLACLGWLGWSRTFNRAALWLLILTAVVHTAGLVARVYVSGRPPVTNLYESAVFVGWGCVLLGLVFEMIHGLGLGSIVASVIGFLTLLISDYLGLSGDTIKVMRAVLDTNFWLATHVVCISFGYATAFVAGVFGLIYVLRGVLTSSLDDRASAALTRMTYGTLCFAIFFSFVGTVLGGLWADDSWGRFWGWDPKENGALIIVLWIALVLHARWGKMVGPRGLAGLAIAGNIVTAWSWFGVNALEVGLHSYGFNSGTVLWLVVFVISQLAVIGLGLLLLPASMQDA